MWKHVTRSDRLLKEYTRDVLAVTRLDGGLYSRTHRFSSMARTPALLMLLREADTPRQTHLERRAIRVKISFCGEF